MISKKTFSVKKRKEKKGVKLEFPSKILSQTQSQLFLLKLQLQLLRAGAQAKLQE